MSMFEHGAPSGRGTPFLVTEVPAVTVSTWPTWSEPNGSPEQRKLTLTLDRSDFTRDDHRQDFEDYLETAHIPSSVRADFFKFGLLITVYSEEAGEPRRSPFFSPRVARVIAMEILRAPDGAE